MRFFLSLFLLIGLLWASPAKADNYYGTGYTSYRVGYSVAYPAPSYYTTNYGCHNSIYDGQLHFQGAGYFRGRWYPAGNYAWIGGRWFLEGYGYHDGIPTYSPTIVIPAYAPPVSLVTNNPPQYVPTQPPYAPGTQSSQQVPQQASMDEMAKMFQMFLLFQKMQQQQAGK